MRFRLGFINDYDCGVCVTDNQQPDNRICFRNAQLAVDWVRLNGHQQTTYAFEAWADHARITNIKEIFNGVSV